jgi:hypothetical protein
MWYSALCIEFVIFPYFFEGEFEIRALFPAVSVHNPRPVGHPPPRRGMLAGALNYSNNKYYSKY